MRVRCKSRIENKKYKSATQRKLNSSNAAGSKKKILVDAHALNNGKHVLPTVVRVSSEEPVPFNNENDLERRMN